MKSFKQLILETEIYMCKKCGFKATTKDEFKSGLPYPVSPQYKCPKCSSTEIIPVNREN